MEIDVIRQLEELVRAFGVKLMRMDNRMTEETALMEFDQGLRRFLGYPYEIERGFRMMEKHYKEKILYLVRDSFEEHYMSFRIPEEHCSDGRQEFIQIGPYIMSNPEEIVERVIERLGLAPYLSEELKEYYYSVPILADSDALQGVVLTQLGYLCRDREGLSITRVENYNEFNEKPHREEQGEEESLRIAAVEERYRYEDQMMEAIQIGDMEKIMEVTQGFKHYRLKPRNDDNLRDVKNMMVVWNTLFRKAVQQAEVHPVYIDRISEAFAKQIENAARVTELADLSHVMMRKYCLLVRNHSVRGYSSVIRDAVNYIDFHIREPLSLKSIAEEVNISLNYLSAQFKKETGKTLTHYMNEKRIQSSLILLATTDLPIHEVAAQVGIYDENYYARLFKKFQGQTAKQYRSMVRMKP